MSDKFKLDDQVSRTVESRVPKDAKGVVLGPSFHEAGQTMYPVKWFGHPMLTSIRDDDYCTLPDCRTRDHWHSREAVMTKESP